MLLNIQMSLIPAYKSSSSLAGPLWLFDDLTTCFFLSAVRLLGFLSRESGLEEGEEEDSLADGCNLATTLA